MKIYVLGSMRNPKVMHVANDLRAAGYDAFEDWISPGEMADERWQGYEKNRGRTYKEASQGHHAKHVFEFDYKHLMESDAVVAVLPFGRSAGFEAGWFAGYFYRVSVSLAAVQPRPVYVLAEEPVDRFDIMCPGFAYMTGGRVVEGVAELLEELSKHGS